MLNLYSKNHRALSNGRIVFATLLALIFGHLLLKEHMPFFGTAVIGGFLILAIFYYILIYRADYYGFVISIYIASHFSYADNQGGLWNIVTFVMLILLILVKKREININKSDIFINSCLVIFLISNIFGWIFINKQPIILIFQGVVTLLGYILMFNFVRHMVIDRRQIRSFTLITLSMLIYLLIVGINQRFAFVNLNTPLLGSYDIGLGSITYGSTNAQGTFRNSELFGEYALLMIALFLPLFCSKFVQKNLKLSTIITWMILIISSLCIMITSTRSAAILGFVTILIYIAFIAFFSKAIKGGLKQLLLFISVNLIIIAFIGGVFGLDSLTDDFSEVDFGNFSIENVISGEVINRGPLILLALDRIYNEPLIIGHGYGVLSANQVAWWGSELNPLDYPYIDFHNMYLSLPFIYGWFGSLAFLLLIFGTWLRIGKVVFDYSSQTSYLTLFAIGFLFFWGVFLVDQFKIGFIRNPGYHMMFWIWLGLSNALVRTIKLHQMLNYGFKSRDKSF